MTSIPAPVFARLRDRLHERCFTPAAAHGLPRFGAEVEFLVLDADTHAPVPLHAPGRGLLALIRADAEFAEWMETLSAYGTPRFVIPDRAVVTFEPGGQIELSTIACDSPSQLLELLDALVLPLRSSLARRGVALVGKGIDPITPIERVPLQHQVDRYQRMTRYFERIGSFGIRMMRQTAAVQISIDRGACPAERWRLLNALAPFVTAIFANSPRYAGQPTGHESYRAHCWRMLDGTRTGIVAAERADAASEYVSFALGAGDMMREAPDGDYRSFGDWVRGGQWSDDQWEQHLTTLFPEVRPRGHFEVRSCDALEPAWYPGLVVLLAGLVSDQVTAREAAALTSDSRDFLVTAGELGLRNERIARTSRDLFELALEGARRLPPTYLGRGDLECARQIYETLTRRGLSPGADAAGAQDRVLDAMSRTA